MHPSKVLSSTMKPSQLHGPLNSHPAGTLPRSPSKTALIVGSHRSPNKKETTSCAKMPSANFDFSFERPESDLSEEAKKIMSSVREEAAKLKAQIVHQKSRQQQNGGEQDQLSSLGGRQIRKAKGKSGRFSDVHKQQFQKMDSIANHASTWKNKLQAETPASLKRSPSKAGLDETLKSIPHSKSYKQFENENSDRLENSLPSKRTKVAFNRDVSMARPISQGTGSFQPSAQTTPAKLRPIDGLPRVITTPTKASLARSASVKSLKTTMIPSLAKSASTWTLASPVAPKTEGSNKRLGSWQKLGGNMKSILHRTQPKFSNDPIKVAAGTHLPVPQNKPDVDKDLPSLPDTPTIKRVDFTSSTKFRHDLAGVNQSSSPSRIPNLQSIQQQPREPVSSASTPIQPEPVSYPDLTASPMITTRAKSPKVTPASKPIECAVEGLSDFTFRADQTTTLTNKVPSDLTSPTGVSTIRPVRPSGIPTSVMPGAFATESSMVVPAIEHGISNKKRKHVSSGDEDDEEVENVDPAASTDLDAKDTDDAPKAKKQRVIGPGSNPAKGAVGGKENAKHRFIGTGKGAKKAGLSLSRLNMLARPKERR